jgi:hypothetical protein
MRNGVNVNELRKKKKKRRREEEEEGLISYTSSFMSTGHFILVKVLDHSLMKLNWFIYLFLNHLVFNIAVC